MGRRHPTPSRCPSSGRRLLACRTTCTAALLVTLVHSLLPCVPSRALVAAETVPCKIDADVSWKTIGDREYGLVNEVMSQALAEEYCQKLGGHLASIHDPATNKEAHQLVTDAIAARTDSINPYGSGGAAWLGLVLTRGGEPAWTDGSTYDYYPWSVNGNNPNFLERHNLTAQHACVHFGYLKYDRDKRIFLENGTWADIMCEANWWPMCARPNPGACSKAPAQAPAQVPRSTSGPSSGGNSATKGKGGLSMGLIIGAAVGGIAAVVVVAVLLYVLLTVRKKAKANHNPDIYTAGAGGGGGGAAGGKSQSRNDLEAGAAAGKGQLKAANSPLATARGIPPAAMGWRDQSDPPSLTDKRLVPAVTDWGKVQQSGVWQTGTLPTTAHVPSDTSFIREQDGTAERASSKSMSKRHVGVAGPLAPTTVVMPGPVPLPHGGGFPGSSGGGPPGGSELMMLGLAIPAVTTCLLLAQEIIDAGDRVIGNQIRCKRLTSRIARLLPVLTRLRTAVESKQVQDGEVKPYIDELLSVMEHTNAMVQQWGTKLDGSLGLLRAMLAGRAYEREFMDLNDRLGHLMTDLSALLNVRQGTGLGYPLQRQAQEAVQQEVAADTVKDLQQLAVQVAADPKMLEGLSAQERAALQATFREHKLDLDEMTAMLRTQARQQFIDGRMADFLIRWQDIQLGNKIGAGGFGEVHLARWDGRRVAVKVLQVGERTGKLERDLKREAYIMSQLHHHNVARFYGLVLQPEACALVMAFYPRGTLTACLQDGQPLDWPTRVGYALDVAKGMAYLHSRPYEPIVHGDLKPSNLLLHTDDSGEDCVMITDFGLSRVQTLTATARTGNHSSALSAIYTAPELLNNPSKHKTLASDVYSFGMLMYEIAAREPPFSQQGVSPFVVMNHISQGGRPDVPAGTPDGYAELMKACWAQQPAARPALDEVVLALSWLRHYSTC